MAFLATSLRRASNVRSIAAAARSSPRYVSSSAQRPGEYILLNFLDRFRLANYACVYVSCCADVRVWCMKASISPFSEPVGIDGKEKYATMSEPLHSYGSYLTQCLPKFIQQYSVLRDELTLYVGPSGIVPVLTFLRDHSQCQYAALMDISGADYPGRRSSQRFEVVYHLLSVRFASRIRVKTYADEVTPVPSATGVFRGADW
jgi:hypothetical protein